RVEPLELGVAADAVQLPAAEEVLHGPLAAGAPPSPALAPFGVAEVAGEGGRARGADLGERLPDLGEQVRGGGGDLADHSPVALGGGAAAEVQQGVDLLCRERGLVGEGLADQAGASGPGGAV